jgi:Leu/Phe-tRNA-protein transferase
MCHGTASFNNRDRLIPSRLRPKAFSLSEKMKNTNSNIFNSAFSYRRIIAKCTYRGERIREIEEKWIDEKIIKAYSLQ